MAGTNTMIGDIVDPSTPYVGGDRRNSAPANFQVLPQFFIASLAVLLSLVLGAFLVRTEPGLAADRLVLANTFATAGAVVAAAGAVLCFGRFLMSKERTALGCGTVLALVASGWLLPARVGPMLHEGWREGLGGFAIGTAAMITIVVATLAFLPNVDPRLSIRGHLVWATLGALVLGTIIATGFETSLSAGGLQGAELGHVVAGPLLGVAAAVLLVLGYVRRRGLLAFVGLSLLGLEGAELFAIQANETSDGWWLGASVISLVSASVALVGVMIEYRRAALAAQQEVFESWAENERLTRQAAWQRARQEETYHDLRSGLLGVEAVARSGTLRTAAEEGVLSQELARLRQLTLTTDGADTVMDLVPYLESVVELRLRQSEAVTLEGPESLVVSLPPHELGEIIFNLLDNAARHAPRSPVVITLKDRGSDVTIDVKDRGPGVDDKQMKKIFDRGVTFHEDGSGLGLFICKQILDRLDGSLTVDRRVGGGLRFRVTLPTTPAPSKPDSTIGAAASEPTNGWTRDRAGS